MLKQHLSKLAVLVGVVATIAMGSVGSAWAYDFGTVPLGQSVTQNVTVGCFSSVPCWPVASYSISGPNKLNFDVISTTCFPPNYTGVPGTSCIFTIAFHSM